MVPRYVGSDDTSTLDDAPATTGPTAGAKPGAGRIESGADRPEVEVEERDEAKPVHPLLVLRRLRKLGKEARELQVKITGDVPPRWHGPTPGEPATGEDLARLRTAAEENRQKTAHYHRMLDEAGYMPTNQLVLRRGDRVLTIKGRGTVRNPRSQLVEIRFDQPVRWVKGPQYTLRCPYDRVWVLRSTVEQRPEPESSPQAGVPEASSAAAAGSPRPFAMVVAKHRDPTQYTVTQIIDALVEAERLGVGSKLAQYFRAKLRAEDVERAYARARGIVAFVRDGRSLSPLGRQTYGVEDFGGLLMGLEDEPVVAERLAESGTLAECMNAVTGDRILRWLPKDVRDVIRFAHDYRARVEPWVARDEELTPTDGSGDERSAPSTAASRATGACEVEGSSFDDPTPDSSPVDPTLTERGARDEGSSDSSPAGADEGVSILAMMLEAIEAAAQALGADATSASTERPPQSTHGEAGEEALAERHCMDEPALDGREDDPTRVEDEGWGVGTTACSAEHLAPAPPRVPTTGVDAAQPPRTRHRAEAPRRACRSGLATSPPSWARSPSAASPAAAWRPRPARTPGSRSPRGPPGASPSLVERGPRDGGPSRSALP